MRAIIPFLLLGCLLTGCKSETQKEQEALDKEAKLAEQELSPMQEKVPEIIPISHATAVIQWGDQTIYLDPVGGAQAFKGQNKPDLVLITDIHGDHMDPTTLSGLDLNNTPIIVPQAVKEALSDTPDLNLVVVSNGEDIKKEGFAIKAIPMYNLRQEARKFHPKGRGNGYLLERDGMRIYLAGDTEDIPEMRNLKNIDIALIPMNLPYTMPVENAARGVLAFQPKKVIPYHYRGKDGKADVEKFKQLVEDGNKDIEVSLMQWYPEEEGK